MVNDTNRQIKHEKLNFATISNIGLNYLWEGDMTHCTFLACYSA